MSELCFIILKGLGKKRLTSSQFKDLVKNIQIVMSMVQPNYKIIACDLDETLLSADCSICERNVRAIRAATELGVKFVIATGRGFAYVGSVLQTLGLSKK